MTKVIRRGTIFVLATVLALSLFLSVCPIWANAATEDVTQDGKYVGRTFNADYDKMLEDFSSAKPSDPSANYFSDGVLSVTYDGDVNSNTVDNAIYKIASGTATDTNAWPYDILVIEMSSPAGDASLSDMALYLRDISDVVYGEEEGTPTAIDLTEMLSPFSAEDEIGTEKTKIALDMRTYLNDNAPDSAILAKGVTGYHLVAKEGATGTVWIHDIYLTNLDSATATIPDFKAAGTKTLADFENGTNADQQVEGAGIYWCGSEVGKVIPKHVALQDSAYTFAAGEAGYENIAVTVRGSGALTVKVGGVSKAWSELKGPDGNAVPAITEDFATYVVNLEASGLGTSDQALTLSAEDGVDVMNAFLTNMEVKDSEIQQIPFIDADSAVRVDDFTYGSKVYSDYNEAVADESNADAGVQYRLSYNNAAMLSVADGNLVFDATELGDSSNYINFKTQSVKTIEGLDYFVLKVKGEDGASLGGFRFGLGQDGVIGAIVWGNGGLLSAEGLPVPQLGENNPYTTEDGYCYIVVDLAASGLTCGNTVDMYYSGAGKFYIDEMFFCNGLDRGQQMEADEILNSEEFNVSTTDYQYVVGIDVEKGGKYLTFEARETDGAVLDGLRFEIQSGSKTTLWLAENAEGTAVGLDGNLLPALTEEYQTFVIDLEKSSVADWADITNIHLHATVAQGTVSVKNIGFASHKIAEENTVIQSDIEEKDYTIPETGVYSYVGGYEISGNVAYNRYLAVTLKGTEGIMDNAINLEFVDGTTSIGKFYWKDNDVLLVDPDGEPLADITGEYQTFYIDLDALGVPRDFTDLHIHSTGNTAATLSVKSIGFATTDAYSYADIAMPVFDTEKPTITINTSETANVGDKVTVDYTVSDNVTAEDKLIVSVEVTKDGMPVELTDNAFTAEEGTYIITVTATDEEGNNNSESKTVTVTAAGGGNTDGPGEPEPSEPSESGCNGSVALGSVVGAGVFLAGAAALATALRKKKN